mgnify:CR=1 FL=1
MKSLYEELGGTYRQVGDYFIPDIELPERNYEIGKYGRMRHRYLKEHRKIQYTTMILDGTLYDHLEEIDRICNERIETIVAAMKKLDEQESKYSAELEAQATEFDTEELTDTRMELRPGMDRATVARIQTAYESQHSPFTMAEARRDVSNILGEHEAEPRSVRDR